MLHVDHSHRAIVPASGEYPQHTYLLFWTIDHTAFPTRSPVLQAVEVDLPTLQPSPASVPVLEVDDCRPSLSTRALSDKQCKAEVLLLAHVLQELEGRVGVVQTERVVLAVGGQLVLWFGPALRGMLRRGGGSSVIHPEHQQQNHSSDVRSEREDRCRAEW